MPEPTSQPAPSPTSPDAGIFVQDDGFAIEIAGVSRKIKRLGLSDIFRFLKMVRTIVARGAIDLNTYMANIHMGKDSLATLLLMGIGEGEQPALDFIAHLFDVTPEQIVDPKLFPLAELPKMVQAFVSSPDITAFFSNLQGMIASLMPILKTILPPSGKTDGDTTSTLSEVHTDGTTPG